jgi:hypothetical protein
MENRAGEGGALKTYLASSEEPRWSWLRGPTEVDFKRGIDFIAVLTMIGAGRFSRNIIIILFIFSISTSQLARR